MSSSDGEWYHQWFNQDYLGLYSHRDAHEAEHQIKFIIDKLHLTGRERILDLGCGFGRHAIGLAQRGFQVTGLDQSKTLLDLAKKNAAEAGVGVDFIHGDMRDLGGLGTFDLVLSLFTSFGYFEADEENEQVLKSVCACLRKQGQFLLDYLNPPEVRRQMKASEIVEVEGKPVHIKRREEKGVFIKQIEMAGHAYEERVKAYAREDIERMLGDSGFRVKAIWGDYKGSTFGLESPRQIFLAGA